MVKGTRLLFAECKAARGKLSPAQQEWLTSAVARPGVEVHVWRAGIDSLQDISAVLRRAP